MYVLVNLFNVFNCKFFVRDTKSLEYKYSVYIMHIDKNRHNRMINSEFEGRTTGLQTLS